MSDNNKDLEEVAKTATEDFYELLNVGFEATSTEIKSAYRKVSIKHHPDRNPDDPNAASRFISLGWARDILLDPALKRLYDTTRLRKKERALQDELLDSRRRKMKEDLEARERGAGSMKRKRADEMTEAERREMEIQRLAEDGKRRRKEQQEKMRQQREEEEASFMEPSPEESKPAAPEQLPEIDRTVKIRFDREAAEDWTKDKITAMFSKYGKIDSVVIGKDKKIRPSGSKHRKVIAIVFIVYTRLHHAHAAVSDAKTDYPILESVTWASKEPEIKSPLENDFSAPSTPMRTPHNFRASFNANANFGKSVNGHGSAPGTPSFSFSPKTPSLEEVTMIRLKQAEKKRLEEQIRKEEAAEEAAA